MIKTLVSNVKNKAEQRWRFEAPYVLLHGRNGAGKSSIIHGLELACFGQVFDAAGKDIKLKRHINFMGTHEGVRAAILTNDFLTYEYSDPAGYINAVHVALTAMNGGTMGLCKFLLKYVDNDMPLTVVHQQWDAQVKQHGSYRKALLKMDEVVGKALRSHRAKLKELDIALKYGVLLRDEMTAQRSQAVLHEAQSKDLSEQIKREMLRFLEEIAPGVEKEMEKFIPEGMGKPRFKIVGKDVKLGFEGRPVPSGAETVALAIALAATVLPMDKSVIIFPDRAYDAKTLGSMMRAARTIPAIGVYIQSTILPVDYEPQDMGWQVIKL